MNKKMKPVVYKAREEWRSIDQVNEVLLGRPDIGVLCIDGVRHFYTGEGEDATPLLDEIIYAKPKGVIGGAA